MRKCEADDRMSIGAWTALGASANETPDDDQASPVRFWEKLAPVVLAALVMTYHANYASAQDRIEGSAGDANVVIHWEYDLTHGTGQLLIQNLALPLDHEGEELYLESLLPAGATDIVYDPDIVTVAPCEPCTSGCPMVPLSVFAKLPPGNQTQITYQLPPPTYVDAMAPGKLEYGTGFVWSAGVCFTIPVARIDSFVSVRPVQEICRYEPGDLDGDGDVDLKDFAEFLKRYDGPGT